MATTTMTMGEFIDKFAKEELLGALEDSPDVEQEMTPEKFLAMQTDIRLVGTEHDENGDVVKRGVFKDGVFTADDWDVLAKKAPDTENLELEHCGLKKIEAPKEGNPLLEKIQVLVLGKNHELSNVDFIKGFKTLNTFCVDKLPLIKTKDEIEVVVTHPTMQVVELCNDFKTVEDEHEDLAGLDAIERLMPLFEFDSEEAFRNWCFEKNGGKKLAVVNGVYATGEKVENFSDEEEEDEDDFELDDLEGLSEEQLQAFLEGQEGAGEDDDDEDDDEEEEGEEAKEVEEEKDGDDDSAEPDAKRQKQE